jgi:hypothetical protein
VKCKTFLAADQGGSKRIRQKAKGLIYRDEQDKQDINPWNKTPRLYGFKIQKTG